MNWGSGILGIRDDTRKWPGGVYNLSIESIHSHSSEVISSHLPSGTLVNYVILNPPVPSVENYSLSVGRFRKIWHDIQYQTQDALVLRTKKVSKAFGQMLLMASIQEQFFLLINAFVYSIKAKAMAKIKSFLDKFKQSSKKIVPRFLKQHCCSNKNFIPKQLKTDLIRNRVLYWMTKKNVSLRVDPLNNGSTRRLEERLTFENS